MEKYTVNLADDIECHSLGDTTEYPITVRNNQLYYIKRVPGSVSYVSVLFKVSLEDYTVLKIKELSSFAPKGTYKYHRASFEWKDDSLYIICPYGYAMSKDGEEKFQII